MKWLNALSLICQSEQLKTYTTVVLAQQITLKCPSFNTCYQRIITSVWDQLDLAQRLVLPLGDAFKRMQQKHASQKLLVFLCQLSPRFYEEIATSGLGNIDLARFHKLCDRLAEKKIITLQQHLYIVDNQKRLFNVLQKFFPVLNSALISQIPFWYSHRYKWPIETALPLPLFVSAVVEQRKKQLQTLCEQWHTDPQTCRLLLQMFAIRLADARCFGMQSIGAAIVNRHQQQRECSVFHFHVLTELIRKNLALYDNGNFNQFLPFLQEQFSKQIWVKQTVAGTARFRIAQGTSLIRHNSIEQMLDRINYRLPDDEHAGSFTKLAHRILGQCLENRFALHAKTKPVTGFTFVNPTFVKQLKQISQIKTDSFLAEILNQDLLLKKHGLTDCGDYVSLFVKHPNKLIALAMLEQQFRVNVGGQEQISKNGNVRLITFTRPLIDVVRQNQQFEQLKVDLLPLADSHQCMYKLLTETVDYPGKVQSDDPRPKPDFRNFFANNRKVTLGKLFSRLPKSVSENLQNIMDRPWYKTSLTDWMALFELAYWLKFTASSLTNIVPPEGNDPLPLLVKAARNRAQLQNDHKLADELDTNKWLLQKALQLPALWHASAWQVLDQSLGGPISAVLNRPDTAQCLASDIDSSEIDRAIRLHCSTEESVK